MLHPRLVLTLPLYMDTPIDFRTLHHGGFEPDRRWAELSGYLIGILYLSTLQGELRKLSLAHGIPVLASKGITGTGWYGFVVEHVASPSALPLQPHLKTRQSPLAGR